MNLVEAREIDPPDGEEPAHWRLLTTHDVNDVADARRIVGFYRLRWTVEQLFRTTKTKGFDIESLRQQEDGPLEKLVAATIVAAVTVMQLVAERDGKLGRPLTDAFDPDDQPVLERVGSSLEGKTTKQKIRIPKDPSPSPPGSSPASAAGPDTMENRAPSSCSEASRNSTPSSTAGASEMCESHSSWGRGRGEGGAVVPSSVAYRDTFSREGRRGFKRPRASARNRAGRSKRS